MDENRLSKLRTDLERFDKLYLAEKQDGEHQKKKSASLTEIDEKLEKLLDRYDLDGALRAFRIKYKYEKAKVYAESNHPNSVKKDESPIFNDKRLIKLWQRAKEDQDLLSDELEEFYGRIKILNDKIAAYNNRISSHKEQRSNHIEEDEEHDRNSVELKRLNQNIEKELQNLNDILTGAQDNPFKEKKARKLWAQVLSLKSLSTDELVSLKTDIRQYEKQLLRVDHHKKVLEDAKKLSKIQFKDGDDFQDEQLSDLLIDQEKLEKKAKKLESYIADRIQKLSLTDHEEL